jgi:putative membrane protein
MKKSFRIICLIMALAFAASVLVSIVCSVALADEMDTRGETVYVETDAEGNVLSMISSVYITNLSGAETVTDSTTLTNIKNVLGSESPTVDGTNVTFKAEGEDVCYQGEASGELPFTISLKYYLDGVQMKPDDIAGKSGRVRIEVNCESTLKKTVETDGEEKEMNVPFSVIGMMTLDEDCTGLASDAKISSQAGTTTIMAVMLPGLAESLEIENSDKIKESFYVEMNTESFELGKCTFIGMTGIIDENDLSGIDDIETLLTAIDEINSASTSLYKGAKRLRNGASTLNDGINEYISGVTTASDGMSQIVSGAAQLDEGTGQLSSGMNTFAESIDKIVEKVDEAKAKLEELQDPSSDVDARILAMLEDEINKALEGKEEEVKEEVRKTVYDSLSGTDLSEEEKNAIADQAADAVNLSDISLNIDQNVANEIRMAILELDSVKKAIAKLEELIAAADELADGANQLADGASEVSSGTYKLYEALKELDEGLTLLGDNGTQLADGTKQLYKGLDTLTDGLKTVSTEGLSKIVEETDGIKVSLSKKDALIELSESYTAFSSAAENVNGSVQFLITTEAIVEPLPIEIDTESTAETETTDGGTDNDDTAESKSFFETIGEWFENAFAAVKGIFD